LEIIQDVGRRLGFFRTVNSAVRSTVPENPTLEPNMKCIWWSVAEIWPIGHSRILGTHGTAILGEGEVVGVSDSTIKKSDGGFL